MLSSHVYHNWQQLKWPLKFHREDQGLGRSCGFPKATRRTMQSWILVNRFESALTYVCTALHPKFLSKGPHPVSHVLLGTSSYKSGVCISNTIYLPSPRSADTSQLVIWKLWSPQESWTWNPTHHFVFTACYPLLNWAFWITVSFTVCVSHTPDSLLLGDVFDAPFNVSSRQLKQLIWGR